MGKLVQKHTTATQIATDTEVHICPISQRSSGQPQNWGAADCRRLCKWGCISIRPQKQLRIGTPRWQDSKCSGWTICFWRVEWSLCFNFPDTCYCERMHHSKQGYVCYEVFAVGLESQFKSLLDNLCHTHGHWPCWFLILPKGRYTFRGNQYWQSGEVMVHKVRPCSKWLQCTCKIICLRHLCLAFQGFNSCQDMNNFYQLY